MTDTAVLEPPRARAKLVQSREDAARHIQAHLDKGQEIKALRIRNGQELDAARAAKLEWTSRTTELLTELFDSDSIAEECNDWVGRIYPEYAEFGNFVEQFYAEMDHRVLRLKGVLKRIEKAAAPVRAPGPAAPVAAQAPVAAPAAPAPAAEPAVVPSPSLVALAGLLVVRNADENARNLVAEFLESLDVEVSIVEETTDMANMLDRNRDVRFAVVLSGQQQSGHDFELGFCAGRLGLGRVILLHSQPEAALADAHSLTHVAFDATGGWQLQLARSLRRSGLNVDLNKLC